MTMLSTSEVARAFGKSRASGRMKRNLLALIEDGLIEGIFMPNKRFIVGVQWHPEFSYEVDVNNRKLINAFVASV